MKEKFRNANDLLKLAELNSYITAHYFNFPKSGELSLKVFSQHNEDGLIFYLLGELGLHPDKVNFCEIGIQDGLECNTAYLLLNGAKGMWIDCDRKATETAKIYYHNCLDSKLNISTKLVSKNNINDLVKSDVNFLSIDIDGNDYQVLESLVHQPDVICVEYNGNIPWGINYVQSEDEFINHKLHPMRWGSSLFAFCNLMTQKGYSFFCTDVSNTNAFFVKSTAQLGKLCSEVNSFPQVEFRNWRTISKGEKLQLIKMVYG